MHKVALQKPPLSLKVANFFGTLGYLTLLFEWFWVFGLLLYPSLKNIPLLLPEKAPQTQHAPLFSINPTLGLTIGAIVTVLCVVMVIYALYTVPRGIAKTSSRVTRQAVAVVIPTIVHHKPISKKESRRLTFTAMIIIKIAAITVPLVGCLVTPVVSGLSQQIVAITALFFAFWVVFHFGIQLAITKIAKLNTEQIW